MLYRCVVLPVDRRDAQRIRPTVRRRPVQPDWVAAHLHRIGVLEAPLRRYDGEQMPLAGYTFEFVSATILELES